MAVCQLILNTTLSSTCRVLTHTHTRERALANRSRQTVERKSTKCVPMMMIICNTTVTFAASIGKVGTQRGCACLDHLIEVHKFHLCTLLFRFDKTVISRMCRIVFVDSDAIPSRIIFIFRKSWWSRSVWTEDSKRRVHFNRPTSTRCECEARVFVNYWQMTQF